MKIAISGSHGLIGSHLASAFLREGHEVLALGRDFSLAPEQLEGAHVLIHLSGASIASGRWTKQTKQKILSSRVDGTRMLVRILHRLQRPPGVFFCASASGYYGSSLDQEMIETSPCGRGFLADVCRQWEDAAVSASTDQRIRTIILRFSPVVSTRGGILQKMLPVFQQGFGGPLGAGNQRISWIALEEIPKIIHFLLDRADINGPINCSSPQPLSNAEFSRLLADVLRKPCLLRMPSVLIKMILGEMGEEVLLGGANVLPDRLLRSGYKFNETDLRNVLKRLLTPANP